MTWSIAHIQSMNRSYMSKFKTFVWVTTIMSIMSLDLHWLDKPTAGRRVKVRMCLNIYGNWRVGRQYGVLVCQWKHGRGLWEKRNTYWSVALGVILSSSYSAPAGVCHPGSKAHLTRAAQREASDTRSSFHAVPSLPGPVHTDARTHRQAITSISISSIMPTLSLSLSLSVSLRFAYLHHYVLLHSTFFPPLFLCFS